MKRISFVHEYRYLVLRTLQPGPLLDVEELKLYIVGRTLRNKLSADLACQSRPTSGPARSTIESSLARGLMPPVKNT